MDELFLTKDGSHSIQSEQFGVSYHSIHGAIQETNHVFINAGLRYKAVLQKEISVLDIGFGTGLNALMTFVEAKKRGLQVSFTGVEAYPISMDQFLELNYLELLSDDTLRPVFDQMHHCSAFEKHVLSDNFIFEKQLKKFEKIADKEAYDIVYFDAFAPNAQPHLWEAEMFERMWTAMKPSAALVTYCAKGVVKRTLKAVGFTIEALPGPPGKREMTRAIKP